MEVKKDYCEDCKKETVHTVVDTKPGHKPTGLLGSDKVRCEKCGISFWV